MLDPDEKDTSGKAFAARTVFIVGPENQLKLALLYPSSTGRNFSEVRTAWVFSLVWRLGTALAGPHSAVQIDNSSRKRLGRRRDATAPPAAVPPPHHSLSLSARSAAAARH